MKRFGRSLVRLITQLKQGVNETAVGRRRNIVKFPGALDQLRADCGKDITMIRKLKSGEFRLYSRKKNPSTGKRRNLGTFKSRSVAEKHEREVQYFKRH